ncbi:hypothetical protein BGX38DRAFT_1272301 [Terfezia claveryi]|nr:hypothetical protein BGX38DRAFT_1272301 [Terfezia claveryi]
MPRKATRKAARLRKKSWTLVRDWRGGWARRQSRLAALDLLVGAVEAQIKPLTDIFTKPPTVDEMTILFAKLAINAQSGEVMSEDGTVETTSVTVTMSLVNQLWKRRGNFTVNTPMPKKELKE